MRIGESRWAKRGWDVKSGTPGIYKRDIKRDSPTTEWIAEIVQIMRDRAIIYRKVEEKMNARNDRKLYEPRQDDDNVKYNISVLVCVIVKFFWLLWTRVFFIFALKLLKLNMIKTVRGSVSVSSPFTAGRLLIRPVNPPPLFELIRAGGMATELLNLPRDHTGGNGNRNFHRKEHW